MSRGENWRPTDFEHGVGIGRDSRGGCQQAGGGRESALFEDRTGAGVAQDQRGEQQEAGENEWPADFETKAGIDKDSRGECQQASWANVFPWALREPLEEQCVGSVSHYPSQNYWH